MLVIPNFLRNANFDLMPVVYFLFTPEKKNL